MTKALLPFACYHHPSTVWFIDDNTRFLENIILQLDQNLLYNFYDKPAHALNLLKEKTAENLMPKLIENLTDIDFEQPNSQLTSNLNLYKIHKKLYDSNRFNEPSVLVTDYAMPSLNGLDFCREIKHLPIKKLMITGEADYDLAVNAFNEGLIDKFILKKQSNFYQQLNQAIQELQEQYFIDISKGLFETITHTPAFCSNNGAVIEKLKTYLSTQQEYYLMDCAGSFLGINKDNQHSAFIVSHEDNIENYYQIAMNSQADKHITEPLKNRSSLTYLWHATDYEHSPQQWQQFMYKANLISEANCYYATTNNKNLLNHDKLIFWRTIEEQL